MTGPTPAGLTDFRPDVVHVHNLFPNWGSQWLKAWHPKLVATLHNHRTVCSAATLWRDGHDCHECLNHGSHRALRHRCYRDSILATAPLAVATRNSASHSPVLNHARTIVVLNSAARDFYQALLPSRSVQLIPNFVESSAPASTRRGRAWLYVGRLTPEKGIRWLLQNWPRDISLHVLGSGPMAGEVARRAEQFPDRIKYVGLVSREAARQQIESARGLIIPSLWSEGIPTVALEALSSGTPILVSNRCSSAAELTRDGAGQTFEIDESGDDLVRAMAEVDARPALYQKAARARYIANFSTIAWLNRIEKVYAEIAAG
ncbi:glycosyltransferase family 4 protein [Rhodococcus sp. CSLK01-03]|uniref:Glycosyltransferase family 4 protein n=2 Tax=Rhodococcus indonesiensis TaxID=3055869 RepID=A0ABT7RSG3_9NOCA|nr:glycosyltransferase family 4 protein [Rhodococcus indonesiensis]MDM7490516.1 glycosyltransferase family 4 protein [Rhodococcus indonesiensis]